MLLSPWHRERENASSEMWAGHGGGSALWEQELGGLPKAWNPAKGPLHSKGKLQVESRLSSFCPSQPLDIEQSP